VSAAKLAKTASTTNARENLLMRMPVSLTER